MNGGQPVISRREWIALAAAAILMLAVRAPFLSASLDEFDSINFDLGVHDYDPPAHRPHPPGYPVYILLAKLTHALFDSHGAGLGSLSVILGAASVVPVYLLFRQLASPATAALASLLTLFNPIIWFNSVRPMSDTTGFFFVVLSHCTLLYTVGRSATAWGVAAGLSGLAVGVRIQALVLVLPLLLYGCARRRAYAPIAIAGFGAGVAMWLPPMVYLSGGVDRLAESFALLVRDALPVEPLLSHLTVRAAAYAAADVLLGAWGDYRLGLVILALGVIGGARLVWSDRRRLAIALLLFAPYGAYHYFTQMTEVLRYTIPIVPLMAFPAASAFAFRALPARFVYAPAMAFIAVASALTVPALHAYKSTPSPPFQALAAVQEHAARESVVVTGHHAFARYLPLLPPHISTLQPMPRREWRTLTEYWRNGGRTPVLFLREARRTMLLLVGRDTQRSLGRWSLPPAVAPFLKGQELATVELVRVDPPRWFCESGFLVTLESGPPQRVKREPHVLYVRPTSRRRAFLASGVVDGSKPVEMTLRVENTRVKWRAEKDFAIRTLLDPPGVRDRYVPLSINTPAPVAFTDVWLEPDDAATIRPARGFYLPERDGRTKLFRWVAPRARASVYLPTPRGHLTIAGWIPVKYYRLPVTISIGWNGKSLASFVVREESFRLQHVLSRAPESPWGELTLVSSHHFVPHERVLNGDRRVLAFRAYELAIEPLPD
ncbi:MAG: glycosyltransferase family 39 protein [Acidobacteria bacterium]|nr:glycosyltransferase family 39 protein [Acidobacteriota bacterium]